MKPIDLDRLEALAKKATPGIWKAYPPKDPTGNPRTAADLLKCGALIEYKGDNGRGDYGGFVVFGMSGGPDVSGKFRDYENARLIAAMNPANVLEMVAEIKRLREENKALRKDPA